MISLIKKCYLPLCEYISPILYRQIGLTNLGLVWYLQCLSIRAFVPIYFGNKVRKKGVNWLVWVSGWENRAEERLCELAQVGELKKKRLRRLVDVRLG